MGKVAEQRLVQRASEQFGVVRRTDCAELGLSRKVVQHRLEIGAWTRLHRGVFLVGGNTPSADQRELAVLFAAGHGAVLSHESAARRLGLETRPHHRIQLMVRSDRCVTFSRAPVDVWRSRDLLAEDVTHRGPFRLTRLGRTLVDLAGVLDDRWLRATLDSALRQRPSNLAWVARALQDHGPGHRGIARLRTLLEPYRLGDEVADSVLESFAMELGLATGRKPDLHFEVRSNGRFIAEVDFAWPSVRLCLELDGWRHHGSHAAFVRDRARDRALVALGWTVLRFTWEEISSHRQGTVDELMAAHAVCERRTDREREIS